MADQQELVSLDDTASCAMTSPYVDTHCVYVCVCVCMCVRECAMLISTLCDTIVLVWNSENHTLKAIHEYAYYDKCMKVNR